MEIIHTSAFIFHLLKPFLYSSLALLKRHKNYKVMIVMEMIKVTYIMKNLIVKLRENKMENHFQ